MILFKILRFFIILIFSIIIAFLIAGIIIYKKNLITKESIKNYITEIINQNTYLDISISDFNITLPDKIRIYNLKLKDKENGKNIIECGELVLNIDYSLSIKKLSQLLNFKINEITLNNSIINIEKENEILNIEKYFKQSKIEQKTPDIKINNSLLNINDIQNNKHSKMYIKNLEVAKILHQEVYDCKADLIYESDNINKTNITSIFSFELDNKKLNKIIIEKIKSKIKDSEVIINGEINNIENYSSTLNLKTSKSINLKDFIKIDKNIIIDKFTAKINTSIIDPNILKITSEIKDINTKLIIKLDTSKMKITYAEINATKIDIKKVEEFIKPYIKKSEGKVDLNIEVKENEGKTTTKITAYSPDINFIDNYDLFNFKNASVKLILNPSFFALNIIKTKAYFPYGIITGNLKSSSDNKNENIEINFNLDDIKTQIIINIKNVLRKDKKFIINGKSSKFDFDKFFDIFNYFNEKLSKGPKSNQEARYNMINKNIIIKWNSDNFSKKDLINSNKIIINGNINKFNNYLNLIGNFKIKLLNGVINNISQNIKEVETYQLMFLPVTTIFKLNRLGALKVESELKNINFSDMGIDFDLNNAKIIINKFYLNSKEFLVYLKGTMNLNTEEINLNVYVINKKDYKSGVLPESLTDAKGRPSLAFNIKGKYNDNKIEIIDATNITDLVEKEVSSSINIE